MKNNLETIKARVWWLLDNYNDARVSDRVLLAMYGTHFGQTKFKESSIKRAGRLWRAEHGIKKPGSDEMQEVYKDVFAVCGFTRKGGHEI